MRHVPEPPTLALSAAVASAMRTGWSSSSMTDFSVACGSAEAHAAAPNMAIARVLRICEPHRVFKPVESFRDLLIAVGSGHEPCLESRGRQINASLECRMKESPEHFHVRLLGARE